MKKLYPLWLLLCFGFRLPAQSTHSPGSSFYPLNKDSVAVIEKMISDGKEISSTDTALALQLLRAAAAKAAGLQMSYLEGKACFTMGEVYYTNRNYDRSINNYEEAGNIFQKKGDAEDEALSYVYMARSQYYYSRGRCPHRSLSKPF